MGLFQKSLTQIGKIFLCWEGSFFKVRSNRISVWASYSRQCFSPHLPGSTVRPNYKNPPRVRFNKFVKLSVGRPVGRPRISEADWEMISSHFSTLGRIFEKIRAIASTEFIFGGFQPYETIVGRPVGRPRIQGRLINDILLFVKVRTDFWKKLCNRIK